MSMLHESRSLFAAYGRILAGFRRQAAACVGLAAVAGLCEGLALLALIPVLQRREQGPPLFGLQGDSLFLFGLLAFVILGAGTALLGYAAQTSRLRLRAQVEERFRSGMSEALLSMEWTRFLALKSGDIGKSLIMEGFQIASGAQFFVQALGLCCVILVFLGTALALSVEMTGYTLVFGAGAMLLYRLIAARGHAHADRLSPLLSRIGEQVSELFNQLKFFRGTGRTAQAREQAGRMFRDYAAAFFASQRYGEIMRLLVELGAVLFVALFLWVMLMAREYSVAQALVFLAVFYRLTPRLATVQKCLYQARGALSFYHSWQRRMDLAGQAQAGRFGSRAPVFERELRLEGVSYTYPGSARPALRDVRLRLPRHGCLAVTGASGSGKSTLLDLLLGLLPAQSGRILVDGAPLRELDIEAWRGRIGLVLQDSPVFHASVLENIAWGAAHPDRERALDAARQAHCLEFIEALPQGLESMVGERGARLSGGERQRLALARALYREPWLLLLDEATSALDPEAEAQVLAALAHLKGRCAMLLVAHSPAATRLADTVLLMDNGTLREVPTT